MKKYLRLGICFALLVSVFLSPSTTVHAQSRWYGLGYITGSFKGGQAKIERATPTVRDGGFSAETLWVSNDSGAVKWVEVGWTKEDPPDSRPMGVYLYYAWDDGLNYYQKFLETTGSHNIYKIGYASGNSWNVFINGVLRATVNAGFSTANRIDAGGEVTSNTNAMGVSGTLNLTYKNTSNTWFSWSNTQIYENLPYYHVVRLNNKSDNYLQNYGNNP